MGPLPRMKMLWRSVRLGIGLRMRVCMRERQPVPRGGWASMHHDEQSGMPHLTLPIKCIYLL
jgi:hypothetical protein